MKKIILFVFTVSFFVFTGCKSGDAGDPKIVLTKFFEAISKKNIDEAKKYVTKDSEGMMGMVQMGMQSAGDKSNDMLNYGKENIEFGTATIDGDKATVPIKDKKSGESTDFTLKNEGGEWKVAFDKSTLMEMAQKKMKEHGMGGMRGMNDSLSGMSKEDMQHIDSIKNDAIQQGQKMMDSANIKGDK
ncbi:MAG: hypothetical protein ABJA90_06415 [Ginsengibacter sp.]